MELKIYTQQGALKATVSPSDSSTHQHELMGENVVHLAFTSPEYIALDVNDYIELEGARYYLRTACKPEQKSTLEYAYNVKFEGRESEAIRVKMLHTTDGDFEPKFSLYETPRLHLEKVIGNLNRIHADQRAPGEVEWVIGQVIDAPKQNIEYSNVTCAEALASIAETFETEWWVEGNTVNLCRCEFGEAVELGYMQGLTDLNRGDNDNVPFFTRLIPLGTTRNIDRSTYGYTRLQLPDRARYVEQNAAEYGLYEAIEEDTFAHIYPRRTGTISAVRSEERKDENGDYTVYLFKDADLTFNPNDYDIAELVKRVVFQSGELNGRDMEIVDYHADKAEFEIKTEFPDPDTQLPGGHLVPKTGDQYILYNLRMPQEYITAAEQEYRQAVDEYLAKYSEDTSIYRGNTDYIDIDERKVVLRIGRRTRLLSDNYFRETGYRDSRITKVTRNLNNLSKATIECTNAVGKGRLASIESNVNEIKNVIADRLDATAMNLLRTWDSGDATDMNVFSAARAIREIYRRALRKDAPDQTEYLLKLLGGLLVENGIVADKLDADLVKTLALIVDKLATIKELNVTSLASLFNAVVNNKLVTDTIESKEFTEGALGSGYTLRRDPVTGKSYAEVDELFVRLKATFRELVIEKLSHVGGEIILTPASMKCSKVESFATYFRCYFDNNDGEKEIYNQFAIGDQARCQTFNIKPSVYENISNRYYWRLVVGIGENYIDLSRVDCDANSDIPAAGDDICQLGNRTDTDRQNAIVLSAYGADAPSFKQYAGINGYSMSGKEVTKFSTKGNKITGDLYLSTGKSVETGITEAKLKAEEAVQDASTASDKADAAQGIANTAKNRLDTWADDGIISPSEKVALRTEQTNIRAEKLEIIDNAVKYSVDYTAYLAAYTDYNADLTYHTYASPENITVLATFAPRQAAYYAARTAILTAISTAAKNYAQSVATGAAGSVRTELSTRMEALAGDITLGVSEAKTYADGKVDNLQIGGRNLLPGTSNGNGWPSSCWVGSNTFGLTQASTLETYMHSPHINLPGNEVMTLSFEHKEDSAISDCEFFILPGYDINTFGYIRCEYTKSTQWKKEVFTFGTPPGWENGMPVRFRVDHNGSVGGVPASIWIRNVKLEKGNKPTDWTPAPEDVDAAISAAKAAGDNAQNTANIARTESAAGLQILSTQIESKVNRTDFAVADIRSRIATGKMLYTDPTFKSGHNGTYIYNNFGNGQVGVYHELFGNTCPNDSGNVLRIHVYSQNVTPGFGGFTFIYTGHPNQELVCRIVAKIPQGMIIQWQANYMGEGVLVEWVTSTAGTGDWAEYIVHVRVGTGDNISSGFFFNLAGAWLGEFDWHVAYATIFDVTGCTEYTPLATYETRVLQLSDSITSKADRTVTDGLTNRLNNAEQRITPEEIQSTVRSQTEIIARNAVDNLQIGGRNLLRNSGNWKIPGWNGGIGDNGGGYTIDPDVIFNGMTTVRTFVGTGLYHPFIYLENNVEYTYSAMVLCNETIAGNGVTPLHWHAGLNFVHESKLSILKDDTSVVANVWKLIHIVFKLTADANSFRPFLYRGPNSSTIMRVAWMKLEKGNKPTDWTPAPEDAEADTAAKYTTKIEYATKILQLDNSILQSATKTDVNALGTRLYYAEQQMQPDVINYVVQSQINTKIANSQQDILNKNGAQLLPQDWEVGSGGCTGYNQNGNTNENARVYGLNHLGQNVVLWECRPNGGNDADGGWDGIRVPINKTKTYRFSVFIKKSDANGSLYFGPANGGTICDLNTTAVNYNPYFAGIQELPVYNRWYLFTGYVYPYGTNNNSHAGEIWDCVTGERWLSGLLCYNWANTDVTFHRCYHYYNHTTVTRQWMWQPRIDLIDGNEPSIMQLLGSTFEQMKSQMTIGAGYFYIGSKAISMAGAVTFSSLASDAQGRINTAQNTADTAIANANAANIYAANAQANAQNNLAINMGYASYADMVAKAVAGQTLINGGYIRTELINAKGLNVHDAILENVYVTGSLRNAFCPDTKSEFIAGYNDNVLIDHSPSRMSPEYNLPWDYSQSGRVIRILGQKSYDGLYRDIQIDAPYGKYFFENGAQKSSLVIDGECVELTGYGNGSTFFGWIITGRTEMIRYRKQGMPMKTLAYGIVTGTPSGVSIRYATYDGSRNMSVARIGEGWYRVSVPSAWRLSTNGYMPILVGYGSVYNTTANPAKATVGGFTETYFDAHITDDASRNDGMFMFQITRMDDIY